jgi:hypothetical protein
LSNKRTSGGGSKSSSNNNNHPLMVAPQSAPPPPPPPHHHHHHHHYRGQRRNSTTMRLARHRSRQRQQARKLEYQRMTEAKRQQLLLSPNDLFYKVRYLSPVVLTKYKLLFIPIPKNACTQWLQLFRYLEGQYDNWNSRQLGLPYTPEINGLTYLADFNLTTANEIMTSPTYTRAVFVRDPKERFLSAYLDKVVQTQHIVLNSCCRLSRDCISPNHTTLAQFFQLTQSCSNEHWTSQTSRLPRARLWKQINFVGHMERLADDARTLLTRVGAWDDMVAATIAAGAAGAAASSRNESLQGLLFFDNRNTNTTALQHATQARTRLRQFYTPELEEAVAQRFHDDYTNEVFQLPLQHIF